MKKNKVHKNCTTRFFRKAALSIIICFILSGLLFFVSCTPLNDPSGASGGNGNNTDSGNSISTTEEETTETEENNNENPPPEETGENESGDITINVYYADDMAQYLVGEARTVSAENKYVDALYELMKLPVDGSLHRLIPESTKINSVTVENGLAKVDLSEEFVEDRFRSDTTDILLIYSIVNTLTEFPEINSVSFYIDGEKLDILGELAIDEPIFRRSDLIKE
ncbi:MAG: GerMN domain-containing protein [Actinomycetota bacterium]|nr:GerMN domain-containing protein [Actinomycetota bacterium]